IRPLARTIRSTIRATSNNLAVNRITRQLFTTNRLPHDADTVEFPNRGFTQVDGGEHVMAEFNSHPPGPVVPVLLNNVPVVGVPNIQGRQVFLRRGRVRGARPTIMRLVIGRNSLRVTIERGSRG